MQVAHWLVRRGGGVEGRREERNRDERGGHKVDIAAADVKWKSGAPPTGRRGTAEPYPRPAGAAARR